MNVVTKISDSEFELLMTEGLVGQVNKAGLETKIPAVRNVTRVFTATLKVTLSEDFTEFARAAASSKLSLSVNGTSGPNARSLMSGIFQSPVPIAPSAGATNPPEMTQTELANINADV
jgi:outer membrane PBP1 activator LpoA protein